MVGVVHDPRRFARICPTTASRTLPARYGGRCRPMALVATNNFPANTCPIRSRWLSKIPTAAMYLAWPGISGHLTGEQLAASYRCQAPAHPPLAGGAPARDRLDWPTGLAVAVFDVWHSAKALCRHRRTQVDRRIARDRLPMPPTCQPWPILTRAST